MYKNYAGKLARPVGLCHKILLVMRLTTLIMFICLMQVSASTLAQRINLSVKNATLSQVFKEIKAQTNVDFFISSKLVKQYDNITLDVKGKELPEVLNLIVKDKPLSYVIEDKFVVITEAKQSLKSGLGKQANYPYVTGRIIDGEGKSVSGATITLKGTSISVGSDSDGRFSIKNVSENAIIVITHIGFKSREIVAIEKMGNIVLEAIISPLDEVHVIAYGKESRRFSVGAVNSISASDIEKQPVINPLAALEGLVPGLNITPSSGAPGAAIRVQVRGQNSLSQTGSTIKPYDQPLFVIDGVPAAAQNFNINALNAFGGNDGSDGNFGGISPFNSLNPADIESISILKDVSATAIYGTQGANGVILITTKKGKAGKARLRATFNTAFNSPTRKIKLLSRDQYLDYRRETVKNDGIDLSKASPLAYPDLLLFDQNKSTDWVDYYLGKNTTNTDAHISLSGGAEKTTFFISTGYTNSQYNFPGNFADKRLTLHSNLTYATPDKRFNVSFGSDFSYERNNSAATPSLVQGILTPPNFPDLYNAAGNPNWNYKGYNTSQFVQYAASLKQPSVFRSYNMINSMALSYRIVSDMKFNLNVGYNRIASDEDQRLPASTNNPRLGALSMANFTKNTFETINIEPQLSYEHNFGLGVFSALLGGTYKSNNISEVKLEGSGFSDESLLGSIGSAANIKATDSYNPYKYAGAFARLGYTHNSKYIIQIAGRRDGSSNFGPGRQFANFGSVGLAWIFSGEEFFRNGVPFISYGKFSASYGTVGTDVTTPYQYQQLFAGNSDLQNFQGTRPLYVNNLFNPNYGWDTKKSMNLGLDLGFFKDRILLNVNYYRDKIGNQLVSYALPSQTGFSSVLSNFAAVVQNKGLEFNLTSKNIAGEKFSWSTSFNISANRNKLIAFPGLEQSAYAVIYSVGESVNTVKGYGLAGVNPETGFYQFYKSDGSVTDYPNYGSPAFGGDYRTIANTDPKFIGGLGNTITYKHFSIYFQFQFQNKQQANYLRSLYTSARPGTLSNQPVEILDHWRKKGDDSPIQRLTSDFNIAAYYFTNSSGAYSDGSYVRLRTASLSYTLPTGVCKKLGIADGKFYVSGQNLFLLTNYKVGDPELTDIFSFPIQRTLNFGLNVNL